MGPVRSWIIRAIILSVLAGLAGLGVVMHDWVSPERVREAVLASLREQFPTCEVQIASARLRLFGGICVTDWTLTRQGESEPFFSAPSAVIAHDKEQLNHGRVVIRKIELDGPVLHVKRLADGTLDLITVLKDGPADQSMPTVTIRNAIIHVTDEQEGGLPPLKITASKLNLLNDPLPLLKIDLDASISPRTADNSTSLAVPVRVTIRHHRQTRNSQIRVEMEAITLTPELTPVLNRVSPLLADRLSQLTAQIGIKAELNVVPGQPLQHDIKLEVKDGRLDDPDLPFPVEHLAAVVQIRDGKVIIEKGTAKLGRANAEFSLETRDSLTSAKTNPDAPAILPVSVVVPPTNTTPPIMPAAPTPDPIQEVEAQLDRLELTLRSLSLDDEFFDRLPKPAREVATQVRRMFNPVGSIDATLKFTRTGTDWRREIEVFPNRLAITYEDFRYPIQDVGGWVKKVITSDGTDEYRIQITGSASGRRIEMSGRIEGVGPDPMIDLKIAGTDIPIDQALFNALPAKHAKVLSTLQANARGDFIVECRQPFGVNRCENTFRVRIYDGNFNYVHFPYPLTNVKGHVLVRVGASNADRPYKPGVPLSAVDNTDRVELREFEATHGNAKIWLSGDFEPIPGTKDHHFTLRVQGDGMPLDEDLRHAFRTMKADKVWDKLQPRGKLTFGADIEMIDRTTSPSAQVTPVGLKQPEGVIPAALPGEPNFDPATDLRLAINFKGPTVTPEFFPYELQELAGVLRYGNGKLELARIAAKHGESQVRLDAGEVLLGLGGEIWANLGGLTIRPFVPDPVLIEALPAKMRAAASALRLRGRMDLDIKHLVMKLPPAPAPIQARSQSPAILNAPILGEPLPAPPQPELPDPVIYWNSELKLAGVNFTSGLNYQDLYGTIATTGRYEGQSLGTVLGNVWLDRAVVNKVPLTAAKLNFRVRPQQPDISRPGGFAPPVIEFPELSALLFHGTIGGEARLELSEPMRYRVMLTAANVRLEELAAHYKVSQQAELTGLAQGKIYLENVPDPRTGQLIASGNGQIDVPNGRMLNLPVLLPLLKLLKLQAPDQTAFEQAHAIFELRGDRVTVSTLDLIGTAISLGGWGELDTRGDEMRFEFYTIWSQALKRWLSTPFGDVTSFLSGNLFKIEMVRKNGEMQYKPVMLPVITEPVRGVAERLRNRFNR